MDNILRALLNRLFNPTPIDPTASRISGVGGGQSSFLPKPTPPPIPKPVPSMSAATPGSALPPGRSIPSRAPMAGYKPISRVGASTPGTGLPPGRAIPPITSLAMPRPIVTTSESFRLAGPPPSVPAAASSPLAAGKPPVVPPSPAAPAPVETLPVGPREPVGPEERLDPSLFALEDAVPEDLGEEELNIPQQDLASTELPLGMTGAPGSSPSQAMPAPEQLSPDLISIITKALAKLKR